MTRHILCGVDLTHDDEARAILAEAGRLAGFYDATLSVITVLPDYGSSWVGSFFRDGTLREAAEAASAALHAMVDAALPGHGHVQHVVEIGNAYEKVLDHARRIGADLIVIGAHKPDLKDRLLGPNAARIVRNADVSVMVLRLG